MINYVLIGIIVFLGSLLVLRYKNNGDSKTLYKVTVKFAFGAKTKLVLNSEQYIQFKAWLAQPDGIFDIVNDENNIIIIRQHVSCVEVRKSENPPLPPPTRLLRDGENPVKKE